MNFNQIIFILSQCVIHIHIVFIGMFAAARNSYNDENMMMAMTMMAIEMMMRTIMMMMAMMMMAMTMMMMVQVCCGRVVCSVARPEEIAKPFACFSHRTVCILNTFTF